MRDMTFKKTPRVLMTCDAAGGVWTYALDLARSLHRHGIETVLAGFGAPPSEGRMADARAVADVHWTGLPLDWTVQERAELAGVAPALDALVAQTGADILQVNALSQAAGLKTDARVIAVSHSCVVTWFRAVKNSNLPRDWQWQRDVNADGMARADVVVAPSKAHAGLTLECYGCCDSIAVVPNAVGAIQGTDRRMPIVYAAARWWDQGKNAATLDAVAATTVWPILAFGPTGREDVSPFAFEHVRSLGDCPPASVRKGAGLAGIFISPSIYEPFGLAALEAAAGGAALVLSDIPTYREIWDGAALFAPPRDPATFAAHLDTLARDPDLRARMGAAAKARARRFSLDAQAEAMAALFADIDHDRERA
jgi:glycosyltransferase involved in cell wall biosynthesis